MPETLQPKCPCARCRIGSFTGPVILIVVGAIFLCGEYTPYGFVTLWPVILVVAGLLLLAQYGASREGHTTTPAGKGGAPGTPDSGFP